MFILGHTGIATGLVRAIDRQADLRWVPVVALLPDIIDKPIWLVLPWLANGWTRTVAHSLTGLAVFAAIAAWGLRGKAWPLILAYASHLLLDQAWLDVQNLLWPFGGFFLFPPYPKNHRELWWEKFSDLWTMGGEAAGAVILTALAWRGRLWDRERRREFKATGRVA